MPLVRYWRPWLALLAEVLLLAALSRFDDWRYEDMPVRFVETALFCGVAYFAAASAFAGIAENRSAVILFWAGAVLLRLVAVPLEPADDFYRYQWEGRVQNAGFNPYVVAPDAAALEPLRTQYPDWSQINHRNFGAIYPPGAELLFRGLSRCPAPLLAYKLIFAAADLAAVAVLLSIVGGRGRHRVAVWYAWNPLVVYSCAGAAHFDSLMILPMLVGILCFLRFEQPNDSRLLWFYALLGSAAIGLAISVKLIPLLLLPLFVFALGKRAVALVVSVAIPAGLSLFYGVPRVPIWRSLGQFVYVARVNDLFWWVVEDTLWPNPHQKNYHYNVVILIAVVVVSIFFLRNWRRGLLWAMGTALVLSPVLHPWYCTWILPLAVWRRAWPWVVLSVTLFGYYLFWDERLFLLPWHSEPWLRALILIPPIVAFLLTAVWKPASTAASP